MDLIFEGFKDGVNPCYLTILLFFATFLLSMRFRYREKSLAGLFFIIVVFAVTVFIRSGGYEGIRESQWSIQISRFSFILASLYCLRLGYLHWEDWWKFKKLKEKSCLKISFPFLFNNPGEKVFDNPGKHEEGSFRSWFVLIISAALVGEVVTFLAAVFPTSPHIAEFLFKMSLRNTFAHSFFAILIYSVATILPLAFIFWFCLWLNYSKITHVFVNKHLSFLKIIIGAIYLGIGLGVLYVFI